VPGSFLVPKGGGLTAGGLLGGGGGGGGGGSGFGLGLSLGGSKSDSSGC